jgi:hypothetical protein
MSLFSAKSAYYFKCEIKEELDDSHSLIGFVLFDETEAEFSVRNTLVTGSRKKGDLSWVKIQKVGEDAKNGKMAIELPTPTINFGRNVSVKTSHIKADIPANDLPKGERTVKRSSSTLEMLNQASEESKEAAKVKVAKKKPVKASAKKPVKKTAKKTKKKK